MQAIEAQSLTKYYGKTRGIEDVTFGVEQGEIFGFIGPNGAGKTTTIRTLLNLIHPTAGSATIFSQSVADGSGQVYYQVGYVPSEVRYYPEMTGREVIDYAASFYRDIDRKWILQLIDRFEFDPYRRVRAYSHGNRKKLAIIQALLHNPRLVILDEPTSGLDPLIRLRLFELITELNRIGVTIFFSTHVLEEIERLCMRVGAVKDGHLIQVFDVKQLPGREMKIITFKLSSGKEPGHFIWGEPMAVEGKPGYFQISVQASVNEIVRRLSQYDLDYLQITDPTIEDVFVEMYGSQGGAEDD